MHGGAKELTAADLPPEGLSLEETLAADPLAEAHLPPEGSPLAVARPVMQGFHLWNVKKTYEEAVRR